MPPPSTFNYVLYSSIHINMFAQHSPLLRSAICAVYSSSNRSQTPEKKEAKSRPKRKNWLWLMVHNTTWINGKVLSELHCTPTTKSNPIAFAIPRTPWNTQPRRGTVSSVHGPKPNPANRMLRVPSADREAKTASLVLDVGVQQNCSINIQTQSEPVKRFRQCQNTMVLQNSVVAALRRLCQCATVSEVWVAAMAWRRQTRYGWLNDDDAAGCYRNPSHPFIPVTLYTRGLYAADVGETFHWIGMECAGSSPRTSSLSPFVCIRKVI